jgi:hypothetical protein
MLSSHKINPPQKAWIETDDTHRVGVRYGERKPDATL